MMTCLLCLVCEWLMEGFILSFIYPLFIYAKNEFYMFNRATVQWGIRILNLKFIWTINKILFRTLNNWRSTCDTDKVLWLLGILLLLLLLLLTYLLTYSMEQSPSWEANCLQLVKKFPAFYVTRRFITAITSARHLSLSWASPIQSTHPIPLPKDPS
jgi:hypothetical protein